MYRADTIPPFYRRGTLVCALPAKFKCSTSTPTAHTHTRRTATTIKNACTAEPVDYSMFALPMYELPPDCGPFKARKSSYLPTTDPSKPVSPWPKQKSTFLLTEKKRKTKNKNTTESARACRRDLFRIQRSDATDHHIIRLCTCDTNAHARPHTSENMPAR